MPIESKTDLPGSAIPPRFKNRPIHIPRDDFAFRPRGCFPGVTISPRIFYKLSLPRPRSFLKFTPLGFRGIRPKIVVTTHRSLPAEHLAKTGFLGRDQCWARQHSQYDPFSRLTTFPCKPLPCNHLRSKQIALKPSKTALYFYHLLGRDRRLPRICDVNFLTAILCPLSWPLGEIQDWVPAETVVYWAKHVRLERGVT